MLYILYGTIKRKTAPRQYIHDIDGYFDGYFEDSWIDDWAKRVLLEIDKSRFISPKVISSPILDIVSYDWISGGSKQLIMMNIESNVVYDGDNLGDNCWPLLLELSKTKNLAISLSYYPVFEWIDNVNVKILNTGQKINDFVSFRRSFISCEDTFNEFEFESIQWPIKIDASKFEEEEIDF